MYLLISVDKRELHVYRYAVNKELFVVLQIGVPDDTEAIFKSSDLEI